MTDDVIESSLPLRFEEQVRRTPGQIAMRCAELAWTYEELNRCANHLARKFVPSREADPLPLPLLIGHGALEIMVLLAVMKTGRAYVALDPQTPLPQLRKIMGDVGGETILASRTHADLAAGLTARVIELPDAKDITADGADDNLHIDIKPDALASLAYTSGSTGSPKGVMRSHRSSLHRCWLFQHAHQVDSNDRISHMFGCGFVAAEVDMYGALLHGATLCCYPLRKNGLGPLAAWLAAENITLVHPPVTLWRRFVEMLEEPLNLPSMRVLFLSGEAVYRNDIEKIHERVPGCTIEHRFSSSEASAIARNIILPGVPCRDEVIPVGTPVADKEIMLLDPEGRETPRGEVGEIVVTSRYLSPGYWRRPELTAKKFIPVSGGIRFHTGDLGRFAMSDDTLYHMGRLDAQIKVRGYRIEPQEVEAALIGLDTLKEAAVLGVPDTSGEIQLVGVVAPVNLKIWSEIETRRLLAEQIPAAMIPSRFVVVSALPITPNGKVDRQRLAAVVPQVTPDAPMSIPISTAGDMTQIIARVWAQVLRQDRVGMDDNFFDLGGDSLSGITLLATVEKILDRKLPTSSLYRLSTVREMARQIAAFHGGESELFRSLLAVIGSGKIPRVRSDSLVTVLNKNGTKPPLIWCFNAPEAEMSALSGSLGIDQPVYGLYSGGGQMIFGDQTCRAVADHYEKELLDLFPDGPLIIGGNCRGAEVACLLALRFAALGRDVSRLCCMEYFHPDLFAYPGKLLLLYGRDSARHAYRPFCWGEPGWQQAFHRVPEVDWIPGAHSRFFDEKNIGGLSRRLRMFLRDEE